MQTKLIFLGVGHSVDYIPEIDALFVYGGYLEPQKLHILYNVKSVITPDSNKEAYWEESKFNLFCDRPQPKNFNSLKIIKNNIICDFIINFDYISQTR